MWGSVLTSTPGPAYNSQADTVGAEYWQGTIRRGIQGQVAG